MDGFSVSGAIPSDPISMVTPFTYRNSETLLDQLRLTVTKVNELVSAVNALTAANNSTITDLGDGTLDLSGALITDNLDGTLTIGA